MGKSIVWPAKPLTDAERAVLLLLLQGHSIESIARVRKTQPMTVKKCIDTINQRCPPLAPGVSSRYRRTYYGALALRFGLMTPDQLVATLKRNGRVE